MEIPFEASVYCVDGIGGKVSHVLIHQRSWKIAFLVVVDEAHDKDWLVPVQHVEITADNAVRLSLTIAQLRQLSLFTVLEYPVDPLYQRANRVIGADRYAVLEASVRLSFSWNIPPDHLVLYWGTQIATADGQNGQLHAVRFDPRHQMLAALVIRQGVLWFKKELAVPSRAIASIAPELVQLNVDSRQMRALRVTSPYRP